MKILYAIQGTGNGHIARAYDIVPELRKYANVDVLISGMQSDLPPEFPITYRYYGISFIFGTRGGIKIFKTLISMKIRKFLQDIRNVPVQNYDFVINDFEPITAWACKIRNIPCISLSHQAAVLHKNSPKPEIIDIIGRFILRYYAPASFSYGIHFESYDSTIFTPVIRSAVRNSPTITRNHYTVYLPSYDDSFLISFLKI